MRCEVAIFAHNEEQTIGRALCTVLNQDWGSVICTGVTVVATACTDGTTNIVTEWMQADSRVKLIREQERRGKVFSVNHFCDASSAPILLLMDADVIPSQTAMRDLVQMLTRPDAGMAVPRRSILPGGKRVVDDYFQVMAELHNDLPQPKSGQLIAVRRELARSNEAVGVDDAWQEWNCVRNGLKVVRCDTAIVSSAAPTSIRDAVLQRRRNVAQHLGVHELAGYRVATLNWSEIVRAVIRSPLKYKVWRLHRWAGIASIEVAARALGWWDAKIKKQPYLVWSVAEGTKR